jgi:hypothetical protein
MEIELCPAVSLLPETFNVLVAPVELMAEAINSHPELQRYKILFSGNYSRILSRLNRNVTELDMSRAFNLSGSSASQWAVTSRPSFSEVRYHAQLPVDWIQGHLA